MARRTMTGQLNMFDFFSSMEADAGEVEMVSLMPNFEAEPETEAEPEIVDEPEIEAVPQVEKKAKTRNEKQTSMKEVIEVAPIARLNDEQVAMSRTYEIEGEPLEIAYINYNKVRITRGKNTPEIKMFASSKEAVDYYVAKMQEYESED